MVTSECRRLLLEDPERAVRELVATLVVALQDELVRVARKRQDPGGLVLEEVGRLAAAGMVVQRLSEVAWSGRGDATPAPD